MKLIDLMKNIPVLKAKQMIETDITSVTSRSSQVQKGSAFVCLNGLHHSGADFAKEALEYGASVVICEKELAISAPQIIVKDARFALAQMCDNFYQNPCKNMKVIAVTGTNGKTSTLHFLQHIFHTAKKKTALCSTIGDNIDFVSLGVSGMTTQDPEELYPRLRKIADAGTEYLFLEVSSHALAQKKVSPIHFACAMITNLSQDHLDYHKTMQDYAKAKGSILTQCDFAIIPHYDIYTPLWKSMAQSNLFTYALDDDTADFTAKNCQVREKGVSFEFLSKETIFRIATPVIGNFTYDNSLLAASCAVLFGIERDSIQKAFSDMPQICGRMERLSSNEHELHIYLDYAHTPDALERALTSLRDCKRDGKLWVIFGCGGDRDSQKRSPMGEIAAKYADHVLITEDNSRSETTEDIFSDILQNIEQASNPILIRHRTDAIFYAITQANVNDTLLFAGKGHEDYEILKDGKHPFSERELIKNAYKIRIAQKNCAE